MTNNRQTLYTYQDLQNEIDKAEWVPCRDIPDVFFPDDFPVGGVRKQAEKVAKNLCQECPIKTECLLYATANKEDYGIWGGLLPKERKSF